MTTRVLLARSSPAPALDHGISVRIVAKDGARIIDRVCSSRSHSCGVWNSISCKFHPSHPLSSLKAYHQALHYRFHHDVFLRLWDP